MSISKKINSQSGGSKKKVASTKNVVSPTEKKVSGNKYISAVTLREGAVRNREALKTERQRLYSARYRINKKLKKRGISQSDRNHLRAALRKSSDSLNKLRNPENRRRQLPQETIPDFYKKNWYSVDVKTWETTKYVDNLMSMNKMKNAYVDGKRFRNLERNSPKVLDAVGELEVVADNSGGYYLTISINVNSRSFKVEFNG